MTYPDTLMGPGDPHSTTPCSSWVLTWHHQHWHWEVVYSSLRLHVINSERFLEIGKGKVWLILEDD